MSEMRANSEEELFNLFVMLSSSSSQQKLEMLRLQMQLMEHSHRMAALVQQRNALCLALCKPSYGRRLWMRERHGCFWERDVPGNDAQFFKESFRMTRDCFNVLCNKLKHLSRSDTNYRKCIPLEKRVAIALYTLRTSGEYATIANMFGVSKASVCRILKEFCTHVWQVLKPEYMPSDFLTQGKIAECVEGFQKICFPQCLGALDGCHIEVRPRAKETADYYNYKGWYSMNLLALVDYRYRFMYINVGTPGRCNDSQVFEQSDLKEIIQKPIMKANSKVILNPMCQWLF